ncbi:ASA1 ASTRA-associated protein 1 [Candida maltosa Xu316]
MSQLFTLRSHTASVSYIYPDTNNESTTLYTSDITGQMIKWNLTTRRPSMSWKAHDDSILTISSIHNHLLTHSRDNTIKIWEETNQKMECVLEMPCNCLNFSNVCVIQELVITPASVNSNNLDIYRIGSDWKITRLITDANIHQLVNKNAGVIIEDGDSIGGSRGDFGIIMKIVYLNNSIYVGSKKIFTTSVLLVGFEDGSIIGYSV